MDILITGATGLIGSALASHLSSQGHTIHSMQRNAPDAGFHWTQKSSGEWNIHWNDNQPIDAVIHLAGEPINGRWTQRKKQRIVNSRVGTTKALVETFATLKHPPKVFLSASAIGYYGDAGDNSVDEYSSCGTDFLANLAHDWEQQANQAQQSGCRVVNLRTSLVLSSQGGALPAMLPSFRYGLGATIGSGKQWMSWVCIDEIVEIISFLLTNDEASGPYNLVSPHAVTNTDFTHALAQQLDKKARMNMPEWVIKLLFGEMGELLLLNSINVKPQRLQELGYNFHDRPLSQTLSEIIS